MVQAAGLPELAVADFASYEERAVTLATDNNQLTALKQHLQANRDRCPLFDIEGFTRDFERGLEAAWTRYQAGEPPTSITLAPSAAAVKS